MNDEEDPCSRGDNCGTSGHEGTRSSCDSGCDIRNSIVAHTKPRNLVHRHLTTLHMHDARPLVPCLHIVSCPPRHDCCTSSGTDLELLLEILRWKRFAPLGSRDAVDLQIEWHSQLPRLLA